MFTHDDALWLSDTIRGVYAARTPLEFANSLCPAVNARFRGIAAAVEQCAYNGSTYIPFHIIHHLPLTYDFSPYVHDNPVWLQIAGGARTPTLQLQNTISRTHYHRTDHYNGIGRVAGFSDQLAVGLYGNVDFFLLSVFRDRPFTREQHVLLRCLRPHLRSAWVRLRPVEHGSVEPHTISVGPDGNLGPLSEDTTELLRHYFPSSPNGVIPTPIRDWLRDAETRVQYPTSDRPLYTFIAESLRGRLYARFHPGIGATSGHVVVFERPATPNFLLLRKQGLSTRECEAVHWMAEGKRNAEIAAIIGAAPRTIDKHVEHVLRKPRVGTRAGAVVAARQCLSALEPRVRRPWR